MKNSTTWYRRHLWAILFALCIGVASGLPTHVHIDRLGEEWHGVYPTYNDDELYYLARIQDVYDGHSKLAQPYLKEGKDGEPVQFWIPEALAGTIGSAFGLTSVELLALLDWLLPPVIFLLLYAIANVTTGSSVLALATSIFLSGGLFFTLLNRPVSPQLTLPPVLLFILAVFQYIQTKRVRWWWIGTLSLGVLFHSYAYHLTYALVFLGLLFVTLLIRRETKDARGVFLLMVGGLLIGIPYVIHMMTVTALPEYSDTVWRLGLLETRMPSGILIVALSGLFIVIAGTLVFQRAIDVRTRTLMICVLVASAPIVMNHHLVTGKNLEFSSHYRTIGLVVITIGFAHLVSLVFLRMQHTRTAKILLMTVCGGVIGGSMIHMATTAWSHAEVREEHTAVQRYGALIDWIRENDQGREYTYFANPTLSLLIPAYTPGNVYYVREANLQFMSNREVEERFLKSQYFGPTLTRDAVIENERALFGTHYLNSTLHVRQGNKLRTILGRAKKEVERYPEEKISKLIKESTLLNQQPMREVFREGYIDYVVWDMEKNPAWDIPTKLPESEIVFEQNAIRVYRVPGNGTRP